MRFNSPSTVNWQQTKQIYANRILRLVHRSSDFIDASVLKQLFKGIVRPHIEYGNSVWAPCLTRNITLTVIENVQRTEL
jgi:hypothetical protein